MMSSLPVMETWFSLPSAASYIELGSKTAFDGSTQETLNCHLDKYLTILTSHINEVGE